MQTIIDLRSDTVTRPSPAMRKAMAEAEVGDDVFGEDPTVNRLQARFAEMAGKEAALFVPSGTMGNQICLRGLAQAGDEILCDENSHIIHYEAGAPAALSGLTPRPLTGNRGVFDESAVRIAIRPLGNIHYAPTSVIVIENTHNRGGGTVWSIRNIGDIRQTARERGLRLHLDGARIWNAMVATNTTLAEWASLFDTLTACFSKGLGAPVGSMIAGPVEIIERGRRFRKMLGGGMRQAGILAAAAEYALDHELPRLHEDHALARMLAVELKRHGMVEVESDPPPTNMVYLVLTCALSGELSDRCKTEGVRFGHVGAGRYRLVTHRDVTSEQVVEAARIISEQAEKLAKRPEVELAPGTKVIPA
ncbi:MAG: threonine aldolase family protein [Candidatus Sumerlaeaceae bacterium]